MIELLAKRLAGRVGKGFSVPNLRNMRQFYLTYPFPPYLGWTHYLVLMRVANPTLRLAASVNGHDKDSGSSR